MSDKRYQVFVSSTYTDLKEERSKVIQTLMELDCIPAGMELFPAMDEEQFNFIKRIIDDCDYYILIIGGRYGTPSPEGVSYTEKEFDYAVEKKIPILAFLHEKPGELPVDKSDVDAEARALLAKFREKARTSRLVKFWTSTDQLSGLVATSLPKTIKTYPAVGWVRADQVASRELLTRLDDLHRENSTLNRDVFKLQDRVKELEARPLIENLATLDEDTTLRGFFTIGDQTYPLDVSRTWGEVFAWFSPHLIEPKREDGVKSIIERAIRVSLRKPIDNLKLDDPTFQKLKIQFLAHRLIEKVDDIGYKCWVLTPQGFRTMMELVTVKHSPSSDLPPNPDEQTPDYYPSE